MSPLVEPALHKCEKPDCSRQVKEGVAYCCTPCAVAAAGKYEIDRHGENCEERHGERGPWLTALQQAEKDAAEWRNRPRRDPRDPVSLSFDPMVSSW